MSTEAKVGGFTAIGSCLLIGIIIYLSGFQVNQSNNYKFHILYRQVTGLKVGANVSYAGISAGKVMKIEAYQNKALVTVKIKDNLQIAKDSIFTISSDGLMGEKFVSITPPEHPKAYLSGGETVTGLDEKGLDYLLAQAGTTLIEVEKLVNSMNTVMGNKEVQDSLIKTAINLRSLTTNMDKLMDVIARLASNNEGNIQGSMDDLRVAMGNLKDTSIQVEKMASNLEPVIANPQTAADLQAVIQTAGNVARRTDSLMKNVTQIKTTAGVSTTYAPTQSGMQVDADLRVSGDSNNFLLIGRKDIGGNHGKTNLQVGTTNGKLTTRAGIVDSKLGLGVDYMAGNKATVSLEAYNPNAPRMNLRGKYPLSEGNYLIGAFNDFNKRQDRAAYFGIRHEF